MIDQVLNNEGGNVGLIEDLKIRGWSVKEVKAEEVDLVEVNQEGALHCVDGRKGDKNDEVMSGSKIQGGVLGVLALGMGKGEGDKITEEDVRKGVNKVREAGFVPSVHGDDHNDELGCGFGKLWSQGELTGLPELRVSLDQVKEIVLEMGGEYVELKGDHQEKVVRVNMVEGKTLVPDETGFILDAWVAEKLQIDQQRLMENAVETVEKLNGPRVLEIIK